MKIGVLKETRIGERRVALVPESCKKLIQAGYGISIEKSAGEAAFYLDDDYLKVGCTVEQDPRAITRSSDLVFKVNAPEITASRNEIEFLKQETVLLASLMPLRYLNIVRELATHKISAFSTDTIPRTTRAQSMDTLSSMANISGYKGVLMAANELPKYFPMFMTAAGTVFPAKVFVIGAAVAGLQAIATARRLGANVTATDVRPEVKEQIESLGAKYVGIELKESASAGGGYAKELSQEDKLKQRELLAQQCAAVDIVITTALIGGVFAPKLITVEIVSSMRSGSIIVDLGAEGGGNCELSKPGETIVTKNGVKIIAPLNLPSTMSTHASLLFSRNLTSFVLAFTKDKAFQLDLSDDIQKGSLITHQGEVVNSRVKEALAKSGGA
ncbi:MAG: NAD(P) transhydrogenase subunit alpha [Deltaproteobacteria bacterium GWA2_38_16]|nr:MAG: NAD(P) transhydrogenase subunit alpha [Deltaproteobacteria bacterium GWA2_38_16]OGQ03256.1 MAG: NAD(P) transhydrogenase subunit alpha [Deltaproteobacteria bacterium RIFCSPHIGHO2_02_FULL_38_15]HBQ21855.1 Re/Si-specific NAD(P)(+) transhydrogenase subunit alpha [Deltaproteobacteria bacterium]